MSKHAWWRQDDDVVSLQWNLVCDKNYLVETSQSVFNFGVMVGAIVFTSLADRVGRKPVHLGCQYTMLLLGLAIAVAPSYVVFVILRFFQGAAREVGLQVSWSSRLIAMSFFRRVRVCRPHDPAPTIPPPHISYTCHRWIWRRVQREQNPFRTGSQNYVWRCLFLFFDFRLTSMLIP